VSVGVLSASAIDALTQTREVTISTIRSCRLRVLLAALATSSLIGTALVVVATATAATAAPYFENAPTVQRGYTDSAAPDQAFNPTGQQNFQLGSRLDASGIRHTSRIYATFDLSAFRDRRVIDAKLRFREANAADCTKRAIEVWQTRAIDETPTWNTAPNEITKLDETLTPEFCPDATLSAAVGAAVQATAKRHQATITFEIRVPQALENDQSYARELYWFAGISLNISFNSLPTIDKDSLTNAGFACGKSDMPPVVGPFVDTLQAIPVDADSNDASQLVVHFGVWPIADPAAVTEFDADTHSTPYANGHIPTGVLVDGSTYGWHARATDGLDTSDWSKTCFFTYDGTAPPAPVISSPNYPPFPAQSPPGVPGQFVFSAEGNTDIAGFEYSYGIIGVPVCEFVGGRLTCQDVFDTPNSVRLREPGGTATVKLNPPDTFFSARLTVRSFDRAGNRSPGAVYQFRPAIVRPTVTADPSAPQYNQPVTLTFTPNAQVKNVASYEYTVNDQPVQTVDAAADGTARVTFTVTSLSYQIRVRSISPNGFVSQPGQLFFSIFNGPGVTSDVYLADGQPHGGVGVPGTFTFTPPPAFGAVSSYYYLPPAGADAIIVPADADGRATVTYVPDASGAADIEVFAIDPDFNFSEPIFYSFVVG
jgi:hypothetical protein